MNRFFQRLEAARTRLPADVQQDTPSRDEYEQLRRLWEASAGSPVPAPPDENEAWRSIRESTLASAPAARRPAGEILLRLIRPVVARPVLSSACAAAVLVACVIGLRVRPVTYSADERGPATVTLPDSTVVTLARSSSLSYHGGLLGTVRRADLDGEAYFDVTRRASAFIVETPLGSVRVVGTRFDVRCDTALYVAVSRGVVSIRASRCADDSAVTLHAGEYLLCTRGGTGNMPGRSIPHDVPVWMGGTMTLSHADLRSVCRELTRQLGIRIVVAAGTPDSLRVTGVLTGKNADQVLLVLSSLTGMRVRCEGDGYAVY